MIPEFGNLSLVLALTLSLIQSVTPFVARFQKYALASSCLVGQFLFTGIAFICLMTAFLQNDFSVAYVASHSSDTLPFFYRIGAVWGGHEGSLLLWICMMNAWSFILWLFSSSLPPGFKTKVFSILGLMNAGFLWFLLKTSNPFWRLLPEPPLAGNDLNPILQDPGLMFHPPMLYMGYVGFAITFAFAIAALWEGKMEKVWARWARPWALLSWISLTLGITLGSWWAYHELGWGGWWFWDPVENASFLPWLMGTALIHSLAVTQQRGALKGWTILLAILTFSLSLVGTFLVRSGVLISVHSFANDPARGIFLLKYLFCLVGIAMLLYAFRARFFSEENQYALLSRETFLLSNNVLLMTLMSTILLGTLYPLLIEVIDGTKISVGTPYFNRVFVPLAMPLFLAMGAGVLCRWSTMEVKDLMQRLHGLIWFSAITGFVIIFFLQPEWYWGAFMGVSMAVWVMASAVLSLYRRWKIPSSFVSLRDWGMVLAHIGVGFSILGVSIVSYYGIERDVRIGPHETVNVGNYQFTFLGTTSYPGENYQVLAARFNVQDGNQSLGIMQAEKRFYTVTRMAMTEAAIKPGLFSDLYIALGDQMDNDDWSVRFYYKPLLRFIWLGGVFMILGGLAGLVGKRRKEDK